MATGTLAHPSAQQITTAHRTPAATPQPNVSNWERAVSGIGGGLLALTGLNRGGLMGLGMMGVGAALVVRGVTGNCNVYRSLGIDTAGDHTESFKGVKFEACVTINKPRDEVYARYRDFSRHPEFSGTISSVIQEPGGCSHWTAQGPMGTKLEWDAEIITDRRNELCSWQSTANSDLRNAGSVRFDDAPGGRGTEMHLTMSFEPPLGAVGRSVGRALHALPAEWAQQELTRFKRWLETGQPDGA
jgi:uncharacterized membrane protein